ncbi:MAG: ribonuclease D [Polyangiales bacterium]
MTSAKVIVADSESSIAAAARAIGQASVLAIDVESNGLHAYRARLCTLQIGISNQVERVASVTPVTIEVVYVMDPIVAGEASLSPLAEPLSARGPLKIVHDLAFDARQLACAGLPLGNVFDTAVAARFLGIEATSLSALVQARVGVTLDKGLQHHDWGARPLGAELHAYLAADVVHLPMLAHSLQSDLAAKGIAQEVELETAHRLVTALAAGNVDFIPPVSPPPYVRIKGAHALDAQALCVLRALADFRERVAQSRNVPPFKVLGNEALLELATGRPRFPHEVLRVRGLSRGASASFVQEIVDAIEVGRSQGDVPESERVMFFSPKIAPSRESLEQRRRIEKRMRAFRKMEAKHREVDEQVVLPGHCVQAIVDTLPETLEDLRRIGGIGEFRVARYGEAILQAITPASPVAST